MLPAVHVIDVAPLYRLAIERDEPNAKYNAVVEEDLSIRVSSCALSRQTWFMASAPGVHRWNETPTAGHYLWATETD